MAAPLADQVVTPEKPTQRGTAAAAAAAYEQIWTPDKPEERTRARGRSVAFSVKEVRREALGLRRPVKGTPAADEETDELQSLERELGVGAGAAGPAVALKSKRRKSSCRKGKFFPREFLAVLFVSVIQGNFPQHLSERNFTYSHLAQLKYIMPMAIVVNKILLRDDTTCCMKPDLQVHLVVGAVESVKMEKGETAYSALKRIFRQRLVDFFRDHPEGDDIPEHELPHAHIHLIGQD